MPQPVADFRLWPDLGQSPLTLRIEAGYQFENDRGTETAEAWRFSLETASRSCWPLRNC